MKDAVWFLLITAIGIPIGGVIESLISSRFDRATARQSALLAGSRQRRDAEIAQMQGASKDLMDAATAVQSFAWFVDPDTRLSTTIPREVFDEHRHLIEGAVVGAQRLRAIARVMPPGDLRDSYKAVEQLIMKVVKGSDDPNAKDAWNEDVSGQQPDTVTRAVNATADEIRRLYATYPSELPSGADTGMSPCWYVAIVGALLTAAVLVFLAGWFW